MRKQTTHFVENNRMVIGVDKLENLGSAPLGVDEERRRELTEAC